MMYRLLSCLPLLACLASPALAKGKTIPLTVPPGGKLVLCEMQGIQNNGWIAPHVALMIDKAGKVTVRDGVIDHSIGKPVAAEVLTDNAKRTTYGWTLEGLKDARGQHLPKARYRLTVMKADGAALMSMLPQGYDNSWQGSGRCAQK